jgi:hypothetical protein
VISKVPLPPSGETPNQRSMKSMPPPDIIYHDGLKMATRFWQRLV